MKAMLRLQNGDVREIVLHASNLFPDGRPRDTLRYRGGDGEGIGIIECWLDIGKYLAGRVVYVEVPRSVPNGGDAP